MQFISKDNWTYIWNKIKGLFATKEDLNNKVDKEEGKGLSTNDFTDELKDKVLNAGDSSFTGNYEDLTNKPDIAAEAQKVLDDSNVVNDVASIKADYVTASTLATEIASTGHIKFEFADTLPETGVANTIYFIKNEDGADGDMYDEYIFNTDAWEKVGSKSVESDGTSVGAIELTPDALAPYGIEYIPYVESTEEEPEAREAFYYDTLNVNEVFTVPKETFIYPTDTIASGFKIFSEWTPLPEGKDIVELAAGAEFNFSESEGNVRIMSGFSMFDITPEGVVEDMIATKNMVEDAKNEIYAYMDGFGEFLQEELAKAKGVLATPDQVGNSNVGASIMTALESGNMPTINVNGFYTPAVSVKYDRENGKLIVKYRDEEDTLQTLEFPDRPK